MIMFSSCNLYINTLLDNKKDYIMAGNSKRGTKIIISDLTTMANHSCKWLMGPKKKHKYQNEILQDIKL